MVTTKTPASPSSEYEAGNADRILINDITGGLPTIIAGGEKYLTKWQREDDTAYKLRLNDAVWTPLFDDILFGLTSKPFTREVGFKSDPPPRIDTMAEDIDGKGNNLHVFSAKLFNDAVRDRRAAILVDFTPGEAPRTLAEEQMAGRRPYFVEITDNDLIAVYTENMGGRDVIVHARIMEREVKRDGWDEEVIERVRVLEPGTWTLYRKVNDQTKSTVQWVLEAEGRTTLPYVPLVIFQTGDVPPLIKIARLQIELYRQENNLKSILNRTAFPVYAANKMVKPADDKPLVIGPGVVLFGGTDGEWGVLEPQGTSMEQMRKHVDDIKAEMRRLGMQPLLPGTGTITATATGVEAAKAHSWIQARAIELKDALEQALAIMGDWIGEPVEAEVYVHTDFAIDATAGVDDATLLALRENGTISRLALVNEFQRRGTLSADYDADEDLVQMEEEASFLPDITLPPPGTPPVDQTGSDTATTDEPNPSAEAA
jgi:hypothetical protein